MRKKVDYIPRQDAQFDALQGNLVAIVTANSVPWNIVAAALALLMPLQAAWAAAWLVAKVKANRSPGAVATKKQARKVYVAALRTFIQTNIYHNPVMTDGDIELCGLRPYDRTKSQVPVPMSLPIINMQSLPGNMFKIRFFRLEDETGAIRRGKPEGVARIEFKYTYTALPTNPDQCPNTKDVSRGPIVVNIQPQQRGQTVWFYARWKNVNNEAGPWTDVDSYIM